MRAFEDQHINMPEDRKTGLTIIGILLRYTFIPRYLTYLTFEIPIGTEFQNNVVTKVTEEGLGLKSRI